MPVKGLSDVLLKLRWVFQIKDLLPENNGVKNATRIAATQIYFQTIEAVIIA